MLVVDDDPDVAILVSEALLELGYVVETATDGGSALRIADTLRPHVVLVDIDLPVMDGYELARNLRALPSGVQGLWLVAFSGYAPDPAREEAADASFDAHIMKPATLDVLVGVVERYSPAATIAALSGPSE